MRRRPRRLQVKSRALRHSRHSQALVLDFEEIDSTNEEAKRRITAQDAVNGLWLLAKMQSKGRGRMGREWLSPTGNLYTSLMIEAPKPVGEAAQLSFVAALSVLETLKGILPPGRDIRCKWPNDILVNDRKIAGILLEAVQSPARQTWLIIGIGVNLAHKPRDTRWPATCVIDEGAAHITADDFHDRLAGHWCEWFQRWRDLGFGTVFDAWMRAAYGLGQRVTTGADNDVAGVFLGLNEEGAARIRLDTGIETLIHAGELYFPSK